VAAVQHSVIRVDAANASLQTSTEPVAVTTPSASRSSASVGGDFSRTIDPAIFTDELESDELLRFTAEELEADLEDQLEDDLLEWLDLDDDSE
jgi:hypothetical protein